MKVLLAPLQILICFVLLCGPTAALASHVTDLASAFDSDDMYDFNLKVGYTRSLKRGAIKREFARFPDKIHFVKDLRYSQIRHVLSIRAEAAIWKDLALHVEFPIVLGDTRRLGFAQNEGNDCGSYPEKRCVTKFNSTLVRDSFLSASQVAAMPHRQVEVAGPSGSPSVLELPNRSGMDQLHIGLTWAPVNQKRDSTKPTWIIGFEARISVGKPMEFNPHHDKSKDTSYNNPETNSAVGRGIHEFQFFTAISRRYKYVDPWVNIFYMVPTPTGESLWERTTFDLSGQERSGPQQTGGVEAGIEIIPWEVLEKNYRFGISLHGRLTGIFEGRGYSEMWEIFANNPILDGPCRPSAKSVFANRWNNGHYCQTDPNTNRILYPGITSIENHVSFKASLGFHLDMTKYFRAQLGLSLGHIQQHFITFGDTGRESDDRPGIQYDREDEVNPMYRPYIDQVGHRFRVGETTVFDFFISAMGMF